ncbi:MAG: SRPBCC domain-containing protein [Kofleriaceae bacterium]
MSDDHPTFVYVIWIQAPAQRVWDALKDAELTRQYWGVHKNLSDWEVGSAWRHVDYDDESKVAVHGTVLVHQPPHKLVFTWVSAHLGAVETTVTFELTERFGATRLMLTHQGLPAGAAMVTEGWTAILSSLKSLLETGAPMPGTTRRWGG